MPSVTQVRATLPCIFKERYPDTYTTIDGSELFTEKPCDNYPLGMIIQVFTGLHS